jgi:hypothetical protein
MLSRASVRAVGGGARHGTRPSSRAVCLCYSVILSKKSVFIGLPAEAFGQGRWLKKKRSKLQNEPNFIRKLVSIKMICRQNFQNNDKKKS